MLEVPCPVPVYDQLLLMATPGHQVGCLIQNLRLAAEAMGLGAWVFCGTFSDLILGGYPDIAKGLGFKYVDRDPAQQPEQDTDLIWAARDQGGHGRPVTAVSDAGGGDDRGLRDALPPGCPLRDRGQLGAA